MTPVVPPEPDVEGALYEIIGHLGAADSQSLPSDDQIIMEHVRQSKNLAKKILGELFAVQQGKIK
jgi:Trk K+ transport system NAD-binding subunit